MKLLFMSLLTVVSLQAGLGTIGLSYFNAKNTIFSFTTERCSVRSTSFYKDFSDIYETLTKPHVAQYAFGTELNNAEIAKLRGYMIKMALGTYIFLTNICPRYFGYEWTIENKEDKKFIGFISAQPVTQNTKKYIEIGCVLHPNYQAQGYAKEVGQALSSLFEKNKNFSADGLMCRIHEKNSASRKLAEKMGFECVGRSFIEKPFSVRKAPTCIYVKELKDLAKNK